MTLNFRTDDLIVIKFEIMINDKTLFFYLFFKFHNHINRVTNKIAWLNVLTWEIINICNVRRNTKVYTYVYLFPITKRNFKNNWITKLNKNELNI